MVLDSSREPNEQERGFVLKEYLDILELVLLVLLQNIPIQVLLHFIEIMKIITICTKQYHVKNYRNTHF
jgi:hypothetical protein